MAKLLLKIARAKQEQGSQMEADPVARLVEDLGLPSSAYSHVAGLARQGLNPAQIAQRVRGAPPKGDIPLPSHGPMSPPSVQGFPGQNAMIGEGQPSPKNAAQPWYDRYPVDPRMAATVEAVAGPNAFDQNDVPEQVGAVPSMGNRGQVAQGLLANDDMTPFEISEHLQGTIPGDINLDSDTPPVRVGPFMVRSGRRKR